VCFKIFSENKNKCPSCSSIFFRSVKDIPINFETLKSITKKYSPEEVYTAIDVIHNEYREEEIQNYPGLLIRMLQKGLILPKDYIPLWQRETTRQEKLKIKKEKQEAEELRQKQEDEEFEYYEKKIEVLSDKEREELKIRAIAEIPVNTRGIEGIVKFQMIEILKEEAKANV
jgi:DNA repair exonuclease SbcCD nuclease subunit